MATKIEQTIALLQQMDKRELECVKSLVAQEITKSQASPTLGFLDLSAELRNRIYDYYLLDYLQTRRFRADAQNRQGRAPELLLTNRQVHNEFSSMLYSDVVFEAEYFDRATDDWVDIRNTDLIKVVVNHLQGVERGPFRSLHDFFPNGWVWRPARWEYDIVRVYDERLEPKGSIWYSQGNIPGILRLSVKGVPTIAAVHIPPVLLKELQTESI